MKDFSLEIGNLNFSLEECNYREINCTIMDLWEGMKNKFSFEIAEDLEIQDRGVCIASLRTTGKSTIDECIKEGIVKLLVNNQIYTYDFQHITSRYRVYKNWNNVIENLSRQYDEIKLDNKKAHEYRQIRKETRGRWQGGGFGVKGAIKGAAKAGVLNSVTGAGHSIGNAIGNACSDYSTGQKIKEVFKNPELANLLFDAIQEDIESLVDIVVDIVRDNGRRVKCYTTEEINKGISIYNNYNLITSMDEKKEALKQCFKSNPYENAYYKLYIKEFMKIPLEKGESDSTFVDFIDMCHYFNPDALGFLSDEMVDLLKKFESITNDNQAISLLKKYCGLKHYLITDDFGEAEIAEIENTEKACIIIKDLKVNIKAVNKNIKDQGAEKRLEEIWKEKMELGVLNANIYQELILLAGGNLIDSQKVEIKNAEEALRYLEIRVKLKEVYEKTDLTNPNDVEKIIQSVKEINKGSIVIGNGIYNYMKILKNVRNKVCNYMVMHDNMQENIENFKSGTFCESMMMEVQDGVIIYPKEYFEKSYYCEEKEERNSIREQIKKIGKKNNATDFKDKNALSGMLKDAQELYAKTKLGGEFIQEIKKRLNYLERYERTVLGVLYDTKEEADQERKKVAGNEKYETEEEAQVAQAELDLIDSKIAGTYTALNLDTCVKSVVWLLQTEFKTLSGSRKKEEIKENVTEQYTELCRIIEEHKKNESQTKTWVGASIIATIVVIYLFFRATFLGKIGLIIIDAFLWGKVIELKESKQNYDIDLEKVKEKVDEQLLIDGASVCLKMDNRSTNEDGIRCPECGMRIDHGMKFCPKCGKSLEEYKRGNLCPKCGMEIEKDMKFCPKCGMKIEK